MASGVQLSPLRNQQEPETFGQRARSFLGGVVRYVERNLTRQSLTHFFYRHITPIFLAANAGVILVVNKFVDLSLSESPIATSIGLAVHGIVMIYLSKTVKNKELLWTSIAKDPELVKICLEAGVDPNSALEEGEEIDAPFAGMNLFKACLLLDTESVKHLIKAGVNLQALDHEGQTALMFLCHRFIHPAGPAGCGALKIGTTLIEHGIDLTRTDEEGNTALHLAAQYGHLEIVRKILQTGFNPNVRNLKQYTPLMLLLTSFMNQELAVLFFENQALAMIDLLVEHNAAVNAFGSDQVAALHLIAYATIETPRIAKRLLEHQADPNMSRKNGETPLMLTAHYGNLDIAKVLLQENAYVDAQTDGQHPGFPNYTALDMVLDPDNSLQDDLKRQFIQLLLGAGAQVKKYPDSNLLKEEIQKKYSPAILRFREIHGKFPRSVTQYN